MHLLHSWVVLKEVSLHIVSGAQCLDWLRATRLGRRRVAKPAIFYKELLLFDVVS